MLQSNQTLVNLPVSLGIVAVQTGMKYLIPMFQPKFLHATMETEHLKKINIPAKQKMITRMIT